MGYANFALTASIVDCHGGEVDCYAVSFQS